jgi:hypothetical protein
MKATDALRVAARLGLVRRLPARTPLVSDTSSAGMPLTRTAATVLESSWNLASAITGSSRTPPASLGEPMMTSPCAQRRGSSGLASSGSAS